MAKKNFLLFANGEVTSREADRLRAQVFDAVIAADGGTTHAQRFGFTPDVVIGDLDSITQAQLDALSNTTFVQKPSQEINDLHKALRYCQTHGATHITVMGVTGKRLDHTLNNFSVLCRFDRDITLTIYDRYSQIFIVRHRWEYTGHIGQGISLIPLGEAGGVHTSGLRWPLRDEPLAIGAREGCSNTLTTTPVVVTLRSGILLAFVNEV